MLSSRAHLHTWVAGVLLVVVLSIFGLGAPQPLMLALAVGAAYAIAVVGMDLMTGYAGQPNMGQGGFMAIGAYVSTAMMSQYGWSFLPSLLLSLLVAAVVAMLLGAGALRLAHIGLAIVSFSFAFVVFMLLNGDLLKQWTGQATGLVVPSATVLGLDFANVTHAFIIAVVGLMITFAATYAYVHSKHGRVLMAIKRSEVLPAVMGVNVFVAKMAALVWSSVAGALAGVILAQATGFVTPEAYTANLSILLLAIAAIGGLGTLAGPAIGAIVYAYLTYVGSGVTGSGLWWPLAFLLVLMFSPAGLYGLLAVLGKRIRSLVAPRSQGALGREKQEVESAAETQPSQSAARETLAAPGTPPAAATDVAPRPTSMKGDTDFLLPVLTVRDVTLKYGGVTALNEVGFDVRQGTVHALIGPNGAGKTSLLDVLTGVTAPSTGDILLDGHSIIHLPPYRRTRQGLRRAFQHATLVSDLTVFQNVQLASENGRTAGSLTSREESGAPEELAAEALRLAGVDESTWHRHGDELNGGDQKLVDMARAFVGAPRVILLDEPTSGVTEAEIEGIRRAIHAAVGAGITVVVIDHNVEFVKSVANHVTVLDFGQVIGDGDPIDVLEDPVVVSAFLGGELQHDNDR